MSAGSWTRWYSLLDPDTPEPYALSESYALGVEWLAPCALIEDWGCGKGWLRTLVEPARYRGVDGSYSPFADEVVDLTQYRSNVPGVFMRHVIEHDYQWELILHNALASFTERMALILFSPVTAGTGANVVQFEDDPGVPTISFGLDTLTAHIESAGAAWSMERIVSPAQYGAETMFRIHR